MAAVDWRPLKDPIKFARFFWPDVRFYDKQEEIIYSVIYNDETFVTAANMVGKDFVAGFICLYYFLTHQPCRVVTTSVKDDHLRVLWGEIGRYIQTSRVPLTSKEGGPLICNHHHIRKSINGKICSISYLRGMVSERGEGLAGHHARYTLGVIDEASGVADESYNAITGWAKRVLAFGNPLPCQNFF